MKHVSLLALVSTLRLSAPMWGQAPAADLKHQVCAAESSFAASMAHRDLKAFAQFVSPEAIFFGDTIIMRGKQAVIDRWRRFFAKAKAPFSWEPEVIEVLPSGNLALSTGPVFNPE